MAGAEIIGKEELEEIIKLFSDDKVNLYRYGQNNYLTKEFEDMFSSYMGTKYSHAVSSGTAAIHSALAAVGVCPGDEVITTAWTFVAPIEAIISLGAVPVLVNLDDSYHLDPREIENKITHKTKALVSVPMWAAPNMDEIIRICKENSIYLVEDSAQSLGGEYKGKKIGTLGDIGTFSFDAGKTLHTGEGGMIVTDNKELYLKAAEFSDHGHMHLDNLPRGKDPRRKPGLNYRMSELTSAVGIAQLKKIDLILSKTKENKYKLKELLKSISNLELRKFHDEEGSLGDTLIFSVDSMDIAIEIEKSMLKNGFGTKILPEAMDWHYAGSWTHIFDKTPEELEIEFSSTGKLLRRSVCINIPIKLKDEDIQSIFSSIVTVLNK